MIRQVLSLQMNMTNYTLAILKPVPNETEECKERVILVYRFWKEEQKRSRNAFFFPDHWPFGLTSYLSSAALDSRLPTIFQNRTAWYSGVRSVELRDESIDHDAECSIDRTRAIGVEKTVTHSLFTEWLYTPMSLAFSTRILLHRKEFIWFP